MALLLKPLLVWLRSPLRLAMVLLALGALSTGGTTWYNLRDLSSAYAQADNGLRRFMLYGPLSPVVANVERRVPRDERILLVTEFDPALVAYGFYPRRVWQVSVDEALTPLLMQRDGVSYGERSPDSFEVDWVLQISPQNIQRGGALYPQASRVGQ